MSVLTTTLYSVLIPSGDSEKISVLTTTLYSVLTPQVIQSK